MPIGIDELDDFEDDVIISNNPNESGNQLQVDEDGDPIKPWINESLANNNPNNVNGGNSSGEDNEPEEDILITLLKSKGIEDPEKIKFENEEGNIEEFNWNSLSREEQLNILKSSDQDPDTDLDDSEIDLINQLRSSKMTPEEFIAAVKQQGAAEYAQTLTAPEQTYSIDDLTDDELFIVDLQFKIEDITDDEAKAALDRAKSDPNLYERQMKGIRDEYKRLEDEKNQRESMEKQRVEQEQFQVFQNQVVGAIQSLDKIGNLDINMDNDDMQEIAEFILSTDSAGISYLGKALNDPDTLVRMAWFAIKGEEAIDSITEYFTNEIKRVSEEKYKQGLEAGKASNKQPEQKPRMVIKQPEKQFINRPSGEKSIDDLD